MAKSILQITQTSPALALLLPSLMEQIARYVFKAIIYSTTPVLLTVVRY